MGRYGFGMWDVGCGCECGRSVRCEWGVGLGCGVWDVGYGCECGMWVWGVGCGYGWGGDCSSQGPGTHTYRHLPLRKDTKVSLHPSVTSSAWGAGLTGFKTKGLTDCGTEPVMSTTYGENARESKAVQYVEGKIFHSELNERRPIQEYN